MRFRLFKVHVRRCVNCRDHLGGEGMQLYQVGTVCAACWTAIRAERRALRAPLATEQTNTGSAGLREVA